MYLDLKKNSYNSDKNTTIVVQIFQFLQIKIIKL